MTREDRRLKATQSSEKPPTKHLFIGGWENFDLDSFCKGRSIIKKINDSLKIAYDAPGN